MALYAPAQDWFQAHVMSTTHARSSPRADLLVLVAIAAAVAIAHVLTNGRYGLHRDELQVLDDARHLDWGFVAYPPLDPFLERIALALFGVSLVGLRTFSVLAQAAAVVLTGSMARTLGGRRLAQVTAALAVVVAPLPLFEGTEFQYSTFDYLWCVLIAYSLVRLLTSDDPRWWAAIGAAIGLGLQTKYTMAFLVAGIVAGVLLTSARRYLKSPWLWAGAALSVVILLPNLIWQVRHDFVSLQFLHHIHARDVAQGRADGFLRDQFLISTNLLTAHLWLAGLYFFLFAQEGRRYRLMGWLYVVPFALYVLGKGRGYYLAAAYPMLFAAGAVVFERWAAGLSTLPRRSVYAATFAGLAVGGALAAAVILPLGPTSPSTFALKHNGDLREEIGWNDLVAAVAAVRDTLSPAERARLAIITGNYGETGAVDLYGPRYGLPAAISGTNSAWYRGYGDAAPEVLIVIGISREYADAHFRDCRLAGRNGNRYGIENEESRDHPDILVCGAPVGGWPVFWRAFRWFG
jgi:4-amino-4-deoxy-L-arabinose transferase-like glycosyltransferase